MSSLPVLLGLCVYFLLTATFPLDINPRDLNASFLAKNILNPRAIVTDTSANDYLTLLSAPFDVDKPNPVDRGYIRDDSDGAGTTIFVVDTGSNIEKYPDEQCLDQRKIDTWLVPFSYRGVPLSEAEKQDGYYYPPENIRIVTTDMDPVRQNRLTLEAAVDDAGVPSYSHDIHGHGTQVAILAAGCKTGVARKANLYLIKILALIMKEGRVEEVLTGPAAQLQGLRRVVSVVEGSVDGVSVPRGKAVLVMCSGNWREEDMRSQFGARWETNKAQLRSTLNRLDQLGVTIVMAAGNDGATPRYIDQQFPQGMATTDSPMILVGSTNSQGQLSAFTTPGRGNTPVSLYAQGEAVSTYDFLQTGPKLKSGTSYSTPIVAGLAAYILGQASNPCPYNPTPAVGEDSVGMCMKKYLTRTAFQRVDSNNLLAQDPSQYKYDIPPNIRVVSNGASAGTEEEQGENPGADPTACWSDDTRDQCKMTNITGPWFEEE